MFSYKEALKEAIAYFRGDEMAADVWLKKYALRDKEGNILEKTPHDTHVRLANELVRYSQKYKDPLTFEECMMWLTNFKYIVPQGSIMYGLGNKYSLTSLSNCFVIDPPKDSYMSISRADSEMIELMKRRGGVGTDISNIRGVGEYIDNAASSSCGVTPIMERYSNTTREVGQGGRRGALMLSIDANHKDIREFINYKTNLQKCTGANVSVRIDDGFMNRVVDGDKETNKTFNLLVDANRRSAEPGILFWDTIRRESPFAGYKGWDEKSTNPCVTGDTLVAVADGRGYVSFEQLALEGKDVDVYCADNNGHLKVRKMRNIRVSGFNEQIISVHLDNGSVVKCTPNHKFPMKNGEIKFAKDLLNGDSFHIMSKIYLEGEDTKIIIRTKRELDNHKVVKVSFDGEKENVYTGTVDEFHNYFLGGWESKTSVGSKKISGILSMQCGEIPLTDGDSCRLLAINFYGFVEDKFTKNAKFNYDKFNQACYCAVKMMDSVVDAEIDKVSQIIAKIESDPEPEFEKAYSLKLWNHIKMRAEQGRRTGIGMTGLGDTLAALGYKYGTREASDFTEYLFDVMSNEIYWSSQQLATIRGAAPLFNEEFDKKSAYLSRKGFAGKPRRHIGLLTCAPTGTVSLMTQTTSGIEPLFRAFYLRRRKSENGTIVDAVGDRFIESFVVHQPFKDWLVLNNLKHDTIEELEEGFKKSPWYGSTTEDIDHNEKVYMQGLIQKHIDHSISVTTNLPKNTTNETIRELYIKAWQTGCKGLTVYVDGSREGVLNSVGEPSKPLKKRPKTLKGEIHCFKIAKENWVAFVGLLNDSPYEVFIGKHDKNQFFSPKGGESGCINKIDGSYEFEYKDEMGYSYSVKGLENKFNKEYHNIAILVSSMLRGGFGVVNVIEAVEKMSDEDIIASFKNGLNRVLKKYIKDGEKPAGEKVCSQCKSSNLAYKDGCLQCLNCGDSKCS